MTSLQSARESLRTRRARFEAGRGTIDDVLDAQTQVAEEHTLSRTAAFHRSLAYAAMLSAMGRPLRAR